MYSCCYIKFMFFFCVLTKHFYCYILNLFWIKRDRLRVENESIIIRPIYFIEQLDRCHHVSDSRLVNII